MSWFKKFLGSETPPVSVTLSTPKREIKRGLPVHESEIQGQKLERRDVFVTHNGSPQKIPIETLRARFHAGTIPADAPVLVTNFYCQETYYCGEGTAGSVVAAWEAAPLERLDEQDVTRMIQEFSFPEYEITSKATYHELKSRYARCDTYYRYVASHDRAFKRITKSATKDLVLMLDENQPGWDATEGTKRFAEAIHRYRPELLRTEAEKKAKKERDKEQELKREERRPLIESRNNLTNFPHKRMPIEVEGHGVLEVRGIKPLLREGRITPETLVRYRPDSDWMELCEFLNDWMRTKATDRQIDYLRSLQRERGISAEIPLDIPRQEISDRISALAPKRHDE